MQTMVTEGLIIISQYDIKISEMRINSHIILLEGKEGLWQVDNMATVAILTLGSRES